VAREVVDDYLDLWVSSRLRDRRLIAEALRRIETQEE
jgi:hypothetical protein